MKRFLAAILILLSLVCCKRSPAPMPTTKPGAPLIVTIGGLNASQLGDVNTLIVTKFPQAETAFFGPDNGWASPIAEYLAANPHSNVVCIGHSWGACHDYSKFGNIHVLILIDPVERASVGPIVIPPNATACVVVRAGIIDGFIPARVIGPHTEITIHRSHSAVAHDPRTLQLVEELIAGALQ